MKDKEEKKPPEAEAPPEIEEMSKLEEELKKLRQELDDNIGLALSQEKASAEDMRKGIEMIQTQIDAAFEKLGIATVGETGETFDPNLCNAIAHIEDESLEENVISQVYQKGYMLGDRVVRHAVVQVAN